jgi:hypothetical protein
MFGMGRIEAATLAYERSVLATNPAVARRCVNFGHSVTDWNIPLVCEPDTPGYRPHPRHWEALAELAGVVLGGKNLPNA